MLLTDPGAADDRNERDMTGLRIDKRPECSTACLFLAAVLVVSCCLACTARKPAPFRPRPPAVVKQKALARMGYTIQAGAFANPDNAARFTELLRRRGLEATYFVARTGLYKVQFGNFHTRDLARDKAEALKTAGVIDAYYIVSPGDYAASREREKGEAYLRAELVKSAQSFLGVPYLWGGTTLGEGFDCSGLTMTIYQLNGLDLPRVSKEQFDAGNPVDREDLAPGDLVFFATQGRDKVSHVGLYIGDGRFIHAPGRGKKIRIDSLSANYYDKRYLGGRSYL